jgi:transcription antitermination factor NusG
MNSPQELPITPEPASAWATFLLHEYVEVSKSVASITRELTNILGDQIEVFVPVQTHNIAAREIQVILFDGYAFVKHDGSPDFDSRVKRARGSYISSALIYNGKVSYISGKEITKYREKLKEMVFSFIPEVGDLVEGVDGTFANMVGIVLSVDKVAKRSDVKFRTKTREVVARNLSFLALRLKEDPFAT